MFFGFGQYRLAGGLSTSREAIAYSRRLIRGINDRNST